MTNAAGVKTKLLASTSIEREGYTDELGLEGDTGAEHMDVGKTEIAQEDREQSEDEADESGSDMGDESDDDSDSDSSTSSTSDETSESASSTERHVSAIQEADM